MKYTTKAVDTTTKTTFIRKRLRAVRFCLLVFILSLNIA